MPYNPYNTEGISDEDRALIAVIEAAGGIPTSTTDHPRYAKSGFLSMHRREGTNGEGLAVDGIPKVPGLFLTFYVQVVTGRERLFHEALCGQSPTRIKRGVVIPWDSTDEKERALRAQHMGHNHFSVPKGTILTVPTTPGDDMPNDKTKMDACACYMQDCNGAFAVEYDGGVTSVGDHSAEHFLGSYFSLPPEVRNDPARRFYGIVVLRNRGYVILGTDGSFYTFP